MSREAPPGLVTASVNVLKSTGYEQVKIEQEASETITPMISSMLKPRIANMAIELRRKMGIRIGSHDQIRELLNIGPNQRGQGLPKEFNVMSSSSTMWSVEGEQEEGHSLECGLQKKTLCSSMQDLRRGFVKCCMSCLPSFSC